MGIAKAAELQANTFAPWHLMPNLQLSDSPTPHRFAELEESGTAKVAELQAKVTSVLQLLLARVKKLEEPGADSRQANLVWWLRCASNIACCN